MRLNPFGMSAKAEQNYKELVAEKRGVTFESVWGSNGPAGGQQKPVTMESSLALGAVNAATSLIADTISTFPLESFRTIKGVVKPMDPEPSLVANPSVYGTRIDWVHRCVISMLLRGNAFGLITQRDSFGYPLQIEWLHPDEVSIRTDRTDAKAQWFWRGKPLNTEDFVHIPMNVMPGRVLGISPIRVFANTINTSLAAGRFGLEYFQNGTVPAGMLKTSKRLQPGEADTLQERWRKQARGRGTPVMDSDLEYQQISIAPEESQFLATIKANATTIATIYHLPPEMVGGDSAKSITYTNVDGWPITVARFAIGPYLSRIELALSGLLPRPQSLKFNMDAFQRPDMAARYASYHLALTDGWMKVDEVRQYEGMTPVGGKDGGFLANRPGAVESATGAALPATQQPGGGNLKKGQSASVELKAFDEDDMKALEKQAVDEAIKAIEGPKETGVRLAGRNGHQFTDPRELAVALREITHEE